jgi:S1-C subfamily serine protease
VAVISVLAAILGGVTVLAVGKSAGWLSSRTTTLLVPAGPATAGRSAPVVVAKPVAGNGFRPAALYKERSPGVVTIIAYFPSSGSATEGGQGSGFVVSKTGTILTSAHVITTAGTSAAKVAPARQVYVEFADGDRVSARIVGYDLFDDVGVLHVDPSEHALAAVPLGDSARVVVGEPVAAIGSPFGDTNSLSVGVVSAVRRPIPSVTSGYNLVDAIQTDAPINHGNSGGPLFDAAGRVIGINAQITSSGSNSGFEGVGFAVPIDSARRSLAQLQATGRVEYAYVGIRTEDLTPGVARKFGYAARQGALIDSVAAGPAERAGLRAGTHDEVFAGVDVRVGGDVIVAIDGEPVANAEDVVRIVAEQLLPGQVARFTIIRGRKRLVVPVSLAERPAG